jgi:K+-transporting ATPase ATPase A chain
MTENGFFQIVIYLAIVISLVKPLGWYMARVYEGKSCGLDRIFKSIEFGIFRLCGIYPDQEMEWKQYAMAMLLFNLIGIFIVYLIQRLQMFLPINPQHFSAIVPDLSFNTAVSFVTNTNWQAYGGENTLSYFSQMIGLTVQNFVSAASGMSVLIALIRGIKRCETTTLGNFWVDTVRGVLYILLPLSIILALALISQGVIQNFHSYQKATLLQPLSYQQPLTDIHNQPIKDLSGKQKFQTHLMKEQIIPMGPVASQVAIKQLGSNGGGYFNTNSAHPFENPTPLTNFLEMIAILLIPAAFCYTFGAMVQDTRQGWAILITMLLILVPLIIITVTAEQKGNPAIMSMGIEQATHNTVGGNMEGKETRFGIVDSGLWATITTATGNGSVNAMLDSFTPLGGLVPLWLIDLSESIFGGVGSGLYQMLIFIIVTVFVAGLMVGRTPEYLGKKIESFEMKMASLIILIMPLMVLLCTAIAVLINAGKSAIANPGAHGFSEILYAFSSMTNNNGSAFAGLNANTFFYNTVGGLAMLVGRYWIAIPVLAIAGSLAKKKTVPVSLGTLPTHTPLFVFLLVSVVVIIGALTFFPAFALGPIVEQLMMVQK